MQNDIDIVLPWVDGNDRDWLLEKNKYCPEFDIDSSIKRYRNWDNLHYWFRGIEKCLPWARKIHLITCGHYPKWLNLNNPKLNFVKHSDYIPNEYLPTFKSRVIELNIHRIKDLSKKFILFNDDMFILQSLKELDFFKNDLPCDQAIMSCIAPLEQFSYTEFNNMYVINKYFNKKEVLKKHFFKWYNICYGIHGINNILLFPWKNFTGIYNPHLPIAYKKDTFDKVWDIENKLLDKSCRNKFRDKEDMFQWLFRYWHIMEGKFQPKSILGVRLAISEKEKNNAFIYNSIKKRKYKIICVNDEHENIKFEIEKQKLNEAFDSIFPEKSSYEH